MRSLSKRFTLSMIAVATLISVPAWAADTVCTTLTHGNTPYTNTATIAIASNFYSPALEMVEDFLDDYGGNTSVTVCHNSTTHLLAEINSGTELPTELSGTSFPHYDYFFAANASAPDSLYDDGNGTIGYTPFPYAKGIPVMFGFKSKLGDNATESDLITSYGSSTMSADTTTTPAISSYSINSSTAPYVALASADAPYGVKSHLILNNMMGYSLPTTIPNDGNIYSTLFDNVSLVYDAVENGTNGIKTGFGSKGQICEDIADAQSGIVYIAFTSDAYALNQKAIQLQSTTLANALDSYLDGEMSGDDWDDFVEGWCYGAP